MSDPVVQVDGLTKRYPGVVALDDVSLEVRPREVVGLIGENGAGKSTLLKLLAGLGRPDGGEIRVRGEAVRLRHPTQAARVGIGLVFQEQSLLGNLTVAENIFLGAEGPGVRAGVYRWAELRRRAAALLERIGADVDPGARTDSLSFGRRQLVEVAKVLAVEERSSHQPVILLDEPTSVLSGSEIERLFALIGRLREQASVVFVSHRLEEVLQVSDRVYVMKDAKVVAERDPARTSLGELHELMVGSELSEDYYQPDRERPPRDEVVLRCAGAQRRGVFAATDLEVRAGEIVGLCGVQGSGREALCRSLFGAERLDGGTLELAGRRFAPRSPGDAVRAGVAYVPSERRTEGAAMGMTVAENVSLAHLDEVCAGPWMRRGIEQRQADDWIERLRIKTPSAGARMEDLSGGNQQKVVLAKWMLSDSLRLIVLDHPTRGLDVGAKAEVYTLVRDLAERGIAVLLMSDTLEETIALSHRVVVMRDGAVTARFDAPRGAKPDQVSIMERMV